MAVRKHIYGEKSSIIPQLKVVKIFISTQKERREKIIIKSAMTSCLATALEFRATVKSEDFIIKKIE